MNLCVSAELAGKDYTIGKITGENIDDAQFSYDENYMASGYGVPVSISLPFQKEAFSPQQTRCFFEGLLPEGYTRRTVAEWIHTDESNYLQILAALGKECLGALKVTETSSSDEILYEYEKIAIDEVKALAREGAAKSAEFITKAHLSLTGASGKVGLYYDEKNQEWYLPKGNAPSTHIVKQSHVRLDGIVANEQLSMLTAKELGIEVPDTFIINTGNGSDAEILFATKRYDRVFSAECKTVNELVCPFRLHQEDFAQALSIPSASKYEEVGENHMRAAFDLIRSHSVNPLQDQMKLWNIIVFNFLLGNTDAHLKNFSLLYDQNGKGIHLAPAYDLVSTTVYEQSTRDMAFRIGGIHSVDEITRESFIYAAEEINIGKKIALNSFDKLAQDFEKALSHASDNLINLGFKNVKNLQDRILKSGGYKNL